MGALFGAVGPATSGVRELLPAMAARLSHRGGEAPAELADLSGAVLGALGHGVGSGLARTEGSTLVGDVELYAVDDAIPDADPVRRVLEVWRADGAGGLGRINADFAFAVHDETTGAVTLVRDAVGARPLYWVEWRGGVVFASEYKALLLLPELPRRADRGSLQSLHARKVVPSGRTLLEGVRQVPSGSWLRIARDGKITSQRHFEIALDVRDGSLEEHAARIRDRFLRATELRTRGDGPIGISLSGGVDSMAMVAAARQVRPETELCTFSAGDRPDDPELEWAAKAAERFGTRHRSLVVTPEMLAGDLRPLVWHLEDPIARTETLMYRRTAAEATRAGVEVLLGGHAADGLFGGMPRHKLLALAGALPPVRRTLGEVYAFLQSGVPPRGLVARALTRLVLERKIPPVPSVPGAPPDVPTGLSTAAGRELLNDALRAATQGGVPLWLPKVDRAHAAGGTRWASPFLDPDLIREAFRVPSRFKRTRKRDKIVFREAVRPLLPEELSRRPKFAQRITETVSFCEALEQVAAPLLEPERVRERGLFVPQEVAALLRRPAGGAWAPEHAMRVWTLALTELWAQLFLDGDGAPPAD